MSAMMALGNLQRSGTVLDAIAHPQVVNPVAAMQGAAQAAGSMYQLQGLQAQKALGGILQQATDPNTGVPDYDKARALAAAAGPSVAMGMESFLLNASRLNTEQYNLHSARLGNANAAMSTLIGQYPHGIPQDAANGAVDQEVSSGLITQAEGQQLKGLFTADPQHNSIVVTQAYAHNMTNTQQLDRVYGTRQAITTPQGTYVTTVPPAGPGQPDVMVPHGPSPGQTTEVQVPMDDQGIISQDANGRPARPPKTWQKITVPVTAVPGVPTGGPPQLTAGAASGRQPPPVPPPPAGTSLKPLTTGRPPAQPPPTTGDAASAAGGPPARAEPPQGQPAQLSADMTTRQKDLDTLPQQTTQLQNLSKAYTALRFITTGEGQQIPNSLFNQLQGWGLIPAGATNRLAEYEAFKKYTAQAVIDQGLLQGTDLGRQLAGQANPGEALSTEGNRRLLRDRIGTTIQGMAPIVHEQATADVTSPGTALGYSGTRRPNYINNTDTRGFAWSLYSPDEQKAIRAEAAATDKRNGNTTATDRLNRAIGMSRTLPSLAIPYQ